MPIKKMSLRRVPFRTVDFDATWKTLRLTVNSVVKCEPIPRQTRYDSFADVYALCWADRDRLYKETKSFLEDHVNTLHMPVIESGDQNLLASYHQHWQLYSKGSSDLNRIYCYLNRINTCRSQGGGMLEIREFALDIWKRVMIEPLTQTMVPLLLRGIESDRLGQAVNQPVIHGVINSLVEVGRYKEVYPLQLYEELFENQFLVETGEYYQQEAARLRDEYNSEYMNIVKQKLYNENIRSRKFLHPSSYDKVIQECYQRMVADQ